MKNTKSVMLRVVDGILTDIRSVYPDMLKETVTCFQVIESAIEARGLPFLTITLPDCSKFLESCIRGTVPSERPPYHGRYSELDSRPVFLHGLWSRVFDEHLHVLGDPCDWSVSALRQIYLFAKKWRADCLEEYVMDSVEEYIRIESELPRPRPDTWDSDVPRWSRPSGHPLQGDLERSVDPRQGLLFGFEQPETSIKPSDWALFRVLCSKLSSQFGTLDVWAIRPKHGPGAVSDGSSEIVKYDFTYYPKKLDSVFPADWFTGHDFMDRTTSTHEVPSKLIAVPKTQKGPRLIASEPTAHQWIQGGIQRWLEDAVQRSPLGISISFDDQRPSMALALEVSATGSMATVDLSAASDRLSAKLVEYVFQGNHSLLDALHACRSRCVVIPKGISPTGKDKLIMLRKFAAMGSACTFPVQTIVFTIIGHFALMLADGTRDCSWQSLRSRAHRLRVFGDDIIIDSNAYEYLVQLLAELGLKVNENKSFHKGLFRESCGMDAFNGVDVTPAYLRGVYDSRNPESLGSVIEVSNNFYKRGWWHASDAVLKTVDSKLISQFAVTPKGSGTNVLFTYGAPSYPTKRRWNEQLHRLEYLTISLSQQTEYSKGRGEASLFQYFTECPTPLLWSHFEPLSNWESGRARAPSLRLKRRWEEIV